jgi:AcrR family transcriptional regulator
MGITERRERERQDTRAKIMDAARDLFAREGYEAVSMRRIAETIEYSPTAIYVHFRDKQDLLFQICQADFAALAQGVVELQKVKDPIERIRRMGHAYIRFAVQHPNHYRLMFMTPVDLPPELVMQDANHGNVDRDSYALLKQTCQEAIDQGRIRPEYQDADLVAQTFWSAVHGVASLHIVKCTSPWIAWSGVERLSEATVDSILRGVTVDTPNDPADQTPSSLSLRERAGVRGCESRKRQTTAALLPESPHPNPLPEGEQKRRTRQ